MKKQRKNGSKGKKMWVKTMLVMSQELMFAKKQK